MVAATGGRTSSGASAGRPRPPARHFQFCLPLRPRPRRAPGTARPSRAPPAPPPRALTALRPCRGLSRSRFVCSLTGDRAPPSCGVSPAARGVREASPTLDALPGGEDAAGSPRGRPGQCEPCLSPGAQRVSEVARTFGQGRGKCGTSGPVRGRADTRVPSETRLPTAAPRGSLEARGPLCPAVIWEGGVSPQLAEEPRPPTPFAGCPSKWIKTSAPARASAGAPSAHRAHLPGPAWGTRARRRRWLGRGAGVPPLRIGRGRREVWGGARPPLPWAPAGSPSGRGAGPGPASAGDLGRGPPAPRHLDAERGRV